MKILIAALFVLLAASLMRADEITYAVLAFAPNGEVDYTSAPAPDYDYGLVGIQDAYPNDRIEVWECAPGCQWFYTLEPRNQPPHMDPQPARTPEPRTTVAMCVIGAVLILASKFKRRA